MNNDGENFVQKLWKKSSISRMRKNDFKKDLAVFLAQFGIEFSKSWNHTRQTRPCNFSFLKNSLVQINSKLNSKLYDYFYLNVVYLILHSCEWLCKIPNRKKKFCKLQSCSPIRQVLHRNSIFSPLPFDCTCIPEHDLSSALV